MDVKREEKMRTEFKRILYDLSQSQDALQETSGKKKRSDFYQRLERLYLDKDFHYYSSDIFIVLNNLQRDASKGSIDVLGQNIELIRQGYQKKNTTSDGELKDIEENIRKLYDDLNLEISRILSDEANAWKYSLKDNIVQLSQKIEESKNTLENTEQKLGEMEQKVKETEEKQIEIAGRIESSQKEYIAILGIFAAIVLAFTGGITFSTSVLQNMHQASIYRVLLVVVLIGFVLVNTLFILFKFIHRMTRVTAENSIGVKFPIIFNTVVVLVLLAIVLSWAFGAVEYRDKVLQSSSEPILENVSSCSLESEEPISQ